MRLAPRTGRGGAEPALENPDTPGDARGLLEFREPLVIVCGKACAHELPLMGGVLEVEIHIIAPARERDAEAWPPRLKAGQSIMAATRRRNSAGGITVTGIGLGDCCETAAS